MSGLPVLEISWKGRQFICRPTMNCLMVIENRVPLQRLAHVIATAPQDIPISHICWVIYGLLQGSGAILEPDDVLEAVKRGEISDQTCADIMRFVLAEVFGTGPEKEIKEKVGSKKKGSKAAS